MPTSSSSSAGKCSLYFPGPKAFKKELKRQSFCILFGSRFPSPTSIQVAPRSIARTPRHRPLPRQRPALRRRLRQAVWGRRQTMQAYGPKRSYKPDAKTSCPNSFMLPRGVCLGAIQGFDVLTSVDVCVLPSYRSRSMCMGLREDTMLQLW